LLHINLVCIRVLPRVGLPTWVVGTCICAAGVEPTDYARGCWAGMGWTWCGAWQVWQPAELCIVWVQGRH